MTKLFIAFSLITLTGFNSCKGSPAEHTQTAQEMSSNTTHSDSTDSVIVYRTENLIIKRLSKHVYKHISFLNTNDYGKVACNGMLVVIEQEVVIFDTPTYNTSSLELINFISDDLHSKTIALIPTHFHEDCVGGIPVFEQYHIPIYASNQTIELLEKSGKKFSNPINEFDDSLSVDIGDKKVYAAYYGEGHTKDNIIGYFPVDEAIFGGCLIKSTGASKGNLVDANVNDWSETIRKIKLKYPKVAIVIPGHGTWGDSALFDYTIELFDIDK
ncbi:subclass B1 metallo-beta-lactamase [Zhouia sp. CL16]|nr:subclass B1 metallo-beta-lactamase [Zhouia amylolytica]MCQ0112556.1 subclass B1 metallo-beta-lactamase [Zhouia amylolytica]